MSDWLTHVGVAYGPGRLVLADRLRLVMIGAVLPDAGTPIVVLANRLQFHPTAVESYLQPLQAPLPTVLLACAIALTTVGRRRSLAALLLGMATHYLLDLAQVRYGGGIYLLYPASFASPSLDLYWPESVTNLILLGLGVIGAGFALARPGPRIGWTRRNLGLACAAVALALVLPAVTRQAFVEANGNNIDFYRRPAAYEGHAVALAKNEVVAAARGPGGVDITLRKGERRIAVRTAALERWGRVTGELPAAGQRISVRGVYRDGVLHASEPVHVHFRPLRTWTSLAALVLLAIVLVLPGASPRGQRPAPVR